MEHDQFIVESAIKSINQKDIKNRKNNLPIHFTSFLTFFQGSSIFLIPA